MFKDLEDIQQQMRNPFDVSMWLQEEELQDQIQNHALELNYIGFSACSRVSFNWATRTIKIFNLREPFEKDITYMKNHGRRWSIV